MQELVNLFAAIYFMSMDCIRNTNERIGKWQITFSYRASRKFSWKNSTTKMKDGKRSTTTKTGKNRIEKGLQSEQEEIDGKCGKDYMQ